MRLGDALRSTLTKRGWTDDQVSLLPKPAMRGETEVWKITDVYAVEEKHSIGLKSPNASEPCADVLNARRECGKFRVSPEAVRAR